MHSLEISLSIVVGVTGLEWLHDLCPFLCKSSFPWFESVECWTRCLIAFFICVPWVWVALTNYVVPPCFFFASLSK
jgi:hypothetical protein